MIDKDDEIIARTDMQPFGCEIIDLAEVRIKFWKAKKPNDYKWEYRYFKNAKVVFRTEKAPNLFHRTMQNWILGVYWRKI